MLGATELILIVLVVVLLFGARKLPELARSLGRSTKEFKQGLKDEEQDERRPARRSEDPGDR